MVFAIGGFTDFFDGLAARWLNQQTALGAYLDPVADKLLVISSFIMLGLIDGIPMWLTVVVVVRDALIVVGYGTIYLLVEEKLAVRPSSIGKWSTTFQLFTVGARFGNVTRRKFAPSLCFDRLYRSECDGDSGFRPAISLSRAYLVAESGPVYCPAWLT